MNTTIYLHLEADTKIDVGDPVGGSQISVKFDAYGGPSIIALDAEALYRLSDACFLAAGRLRAARHRAAQTTAGAGGSDVPTDFPAAGTTPVPAVHDAAAS